MIAPHCANTKSSVQALYFLSSAGRKYGTDKEVVHRIRGSAPIWNIQLGKDSQRRGPVTDSTRGCYIHYNN